MPEELVADELAFLAPIVAIPSDLTTRLVYADWLDEHDDPRAEFIRVECELATLDPSAERATNLRARSATLRSELAANPLWTEWVTLVARPENLPTPPVASGGAS